MMVPEPLSTPTHAKKTSRGGRDIGDRVFGIVRHGNAPGHLVQEANLWDTAKYKCIRFKFAWVLLGRRGCSHRRPILLEATKLSVLHMAATSVC